LTHFTETIEQEKKNIPSLKTDDIVEITEHFDVKAYGQNLTKVVGVSNFKGYLTFEKNTCRLILFSLIKHWRK
jgi:hypothetical protein